MGVYRRLESRSVKTLFISSGMVQSLDRRPASTCATGMPCLAATSAHAIVEFTSPNTTTQRASNFGRRDSNLIMIVPVCTA